MARTKIVSPLPPAHLEVCNRQKTRRLNLPLVRQLVGCLLEEWPRPRGQGGAKERLRAGGRLGVYFIHAAEMARLNGEFLGHAGSTDVITFDYQEGAGQDEWRGEIFVSVDDAVASAPRYRATWQLELARYVVHGMLHLRGYDDRRPAARREMKKEENRVLKALSRRFDWGKLEKVNHVARRK
jgi:probable rRNA maturation factor